MNWKACKMNGGFSEILIINICLKLMNDKSFWKATSHLTIDHGSAASQLSSQQPRQPACQLGRQQAKPVQFMPNSQPASQPNRYRADQPANQPAASQPVSPAQPVCLNSQQGSQPASQLGSQQTKPLQFIPSNQQACQSNCYPAISQAVNQGARGRPNSLMRWLG